MSRLSTRIRSDVRNGDLVYRNRGWWVPALGQDYLGHDLAVYEDEKLRTLSSLEWSEVMGTRPKPLTKEAREDQLRRDLKETERAMLKDRYDDITIPVIAGILTAIVFLLMLLALREAL